ncbi:MAG: lantibiotic dehydratase C-terminal domain-containing protein, partial [Streptomyces sp.]
MTTMAGIGGAGDAVPSWSSLHVSLDEDEAYAERLLITAVAPWAAGRAADRGVASWFPERTGAHGELRVHVLSADERSTAELVEAIRSAGPNGTGSAPEVAGLPYEPDTAPFGGAEGFAVCAEHFGDAARTAVETIRATPSREKRLRAAAALLLASALATGPDPRKAVQWLRGHASSLAGLADVADARSSAEEDHFRNEAEWRHRHAATRAETALTTTTTGAWYRQQCAVWTSLTRLREAGRLELTPGEVLRAFTRLLFDQLGLGAHDEAYAAWLVSMDLVSPGPREPFFADSQTSVDRLMHEHSKYFDARLMDQRPDMPGATAEGRQELPAVLSRVDLERPSAPGPDVPRFEEVLLARRSAYGYYGGPVTLDELGALLYFSAG